MHCNKYEWCCLSVVIKITPHVHYKAALDVICKGMARTAGWGRGRGGGIAGCYMLYMDVVEIG